MSWNQSGDAGALTAIGLVNMLGESARGFGFVSAQNFLTGQCLITLLEPIAEEECHIQVTPEVAGEGAQMLHAVWVNSLQIAVYVYSDEGVAENGSFWFEVKRLRGAQSITYLPEPT